MNFPIIKLTNNTSLERFIQFWSNFYIDPKEKRYTKIIEREKSYGKSIAKDTLTAKDIMILYEWKNGGKFSKAKAQIVESIIAKIKVVNELKTSFSQDNFNKEFAFMRGVIWKIFLLHIIKQNRFPIFDQNVCRSYYFLVEGKRKEIPYANAKKEKFYFDSYISFFNKLSGKGINRKEIDEALWAFGKFLKSLYGKKI